jgi:hypothetical protein
MKESATVALAKAGSYDPKYNAKAKANAMVHDVNQV